MRWTSFIEAGRLGTCRFDNLHQKPSVAPTKLATSNRDGPASGACARLRPRGGRTKTSRCPEPPWAGRSPGVRLLDGAAGEQAATGLGNPDSNGDAAEVAHEGG